MKEPTLQIYIYRYIFYKKAFEKNPERKVLERQVKKAEQDIINYVGNDNFLSKIKHLNL